jgi:hypothetical protein
MARFLAKTEAHTSCPLHQSRVPKHHTRICVSSNNTEPSVLHIAVVRSNNNFILSCAPRRICASLSFSIFILLRRLLSPSQVARELHGGPFVWRSNFSLSLSLYSCARWLLSLFLHIHVHLAGSWNRRSNWNWRPATSAAPSSSSSAPSRPSRRGFTQAGLCRA